MHQLCRFLEQFVWEIAIVNYWFPTFVIKSAGILFKTNMYLETIVFSALSVLLS